MTDVSLIRQIWPSFLSLKMMPPLSKQTGLYCASVGALVVVL